MPYSGPVVNCRTLTQVGKKHLRKVKQLEFRNATRPLEPHYGTNILYNIPGSAKVFHVFLKIHPDAMSPETRSQLDFPYYSLRYAISTSQIRS